MTMTIGEQYEWAKANVNVLDRMNSGTLNLEEANLPIQVDVADIDLLPNEEYAMLRKDGFGCSDSSILVGVNPYTTFGQLIKEKSETQLSEEEKAVGQKTAVIKGRELEPFIIQKNAQITGRKLIKPVDMYRHKEFPFLTVNFDAVMEARNSDNSLIYFPDEIKVSTYYGAKHYDRKKAYFREREGYFDPPDPGIFTSKTNTIEQKAVQVGIPPYYYTQLQMEMFHLNAPFGFLTVLFENEWQLCTWIAYQDKHTQLQVILKGSQAWEQVAAKKHLEFDEHGLIKGRGRIEGMSGMRKRISGE